MHVNLSIAHWCWMALVWVVLGWALAVSPALAAPADVSAAAVAAPTDTGAVDAVYRQTAAEPDPRAQVLLTIVGVAAAAALIGPFVPEILALLEVGSPSVLCMVAPVC